MQKKVLLVGLHPNVVDYQKWPELSPEKLLNGLNAGVAALQAEGIDAAVSWHNGKNSV